jgi:phospholipase/carboxylesterase
VVLPAIVVAVLAAWLAHATTPAVFVSNPASHLRTWEVGDGRQALVLLHGFGSSPIEWLPYTSTIRPVQGRRFVFPEGPDTGPGRRGRAWWPLDLHSHLDGNGLPDLSRTRPAGLAAAGARVRTLVPELETRLASPPGTTILGGFSQGGMVSAEVAFRTGAPLKALVLIAPTIVDETSWREGMTRRRGLRVFLAHGRQDTVLAFASSARLFTLMRDAGLAVTWVPFEGGHDVPADVVDALNRFLSAVDR